MTPRRWVIVAEDMPPIIPLAGVKRPVIGQVVQRGNDRWRVFAARHLKNHDAYDAIREPSAVLVSDGEMV